MDISSEVLSLILGLSIERSSVILRTMEHESSVRIALS